MFLLFVSVCSLDLRNMFGNSNVKVASVRFEWTYSCGRIFTQVQTKLFYVHWYVHYTNNNNTYHCLYGSTEILKELTPCLIKFISLNFVNKIKVKENIPNNILLFIYIEAKKWSACVTFIKLFFSCITLTTNFWILLFFSMFQFGISFLPNKLSYIRK